MLGSLSVCHLESVTGQGGSTATPHLKVKGDDGSKSAIRLELLLSTQHWFCPWLVLVFLVLRCLTAVASPRQSCEAQAATEHTITLTFKK